MEDIKCASCGKGDDGLKTCNGCKIVKYCGAACQKADRPSHMKECKTRAAELHDEALFKVPPRKEECPICFLLLPNAKETMYQVCCGKMVYIGCMHTAMSVSRLVAYPCPFCRTPGPNIEEFYKMIKKRVAGNNDAEAFNKLGVEFGKGVEIPEDLRMAFALLTRGAELGSAAAHNNLAVFYAKGMGVERNTKKAKYHCEKAAMGGHEFSRHNLGFIEQNLGNVHRAMKHYMITAGSGYGPSLDQVKQGYVKGHVSKDEYERTLRAWKGVQDEMKSENRDNARRAAGITFLPPLGI